jgi:hypothetical protein
VEVNLMAKWKRQTHKLKDKHGWRGKPGYKIFVADRGAVRFNFPENWTVIPDPDSIKLYDRQPPDDTCRLAVSYMRLPPVDWSGLPLARLVEVAIEGDERGTVEKGPIVEVQRPDLELAWTEVSFIDPTERREARSRLCLGRAANIQSLITFDFWPEDVARHDPVWEEVLRSLQLGRYVSDPTVGDVVH